MNEEFISKKVLLFAGGGKKSRLIGAKPTNIMIKTPSEEKTEKHARAKALKNISTFEKIILLKKSGAQKRASSFLKHIDFIKTSFLKTSLCMPLLATF